MLRAFFISLSKARWAQQWISRWGAAWRAASRFIAGETPEDAVQAVLQLNQKGLVATLDHLGEHTESREAALQSTDDILAILSEIQDSGVQANVSIKLSQLGLLIDLQLCKNCLQKILAYSAQVGNFIRIDMEDSGLTDLTLDILFWAKQQNFHNVGVVVQSYLYRSASDVERLLSAGIPVRLVKGAYQEPASVAYPKKLDVDKNFDQLTDMLIQGAVKSGSPTRSGDGRFPPVPAIATHDPQRINYAIQSAQQYGLPKDALEFQMLYGIRRDLQEKLVQEGYPVRVYVPYGTHWYPYFMRRLAERPANVWFFISNFFKH